MRGVLQDNIGSVTFTVLLSDGRMKRHVDHIKLAVPSEPEGDQSDNVDPK